MYNVIVSACLCLLATASVPQEKLSPQESFFLRRMTEFWKDRDFALVQTQIDAFLKDHPDSIIKDNLHAILADILYQQQSYEEALVSYEKISEKSLQQKTLSRRCQCLYMLGRFDEVIDLLTIALGNTETKLDSRQEMEFILADSLYRKFKASDRLEEQNALASRAKPLLVALYATPYKEKVIFPLAEIHRMLDELPEATALYIALADQMPEKKEEILLQVASLQMKFNKTAAIETYQQLVNLGQANASDAAYNELLLLFQENRFADLVSRASVIETKLDQEHQSMFNFCLGRSYFKLEQYPQAIASYTKYLEAEHETTPYKRAAFLTLMTCAQKTSNDALFETTLGKFLEAFPKDEEGGKALLLQAQTAMQSGAIDKAAASLQRLLTEFPDISEKETLLYDLAILLSKSERWEESRAAFLSYADQFPKSSHLAIWSSIVHCSIQELKTATEETSAVKKAQLASDLDQALGQPNLFTQDEQASYRFLLGQLLYDLKQYPESLSTLARFCAEFPNHPSIPQAFLLQAHLHRELKSAPETFITIAEKAFDLTTEADNKTALRLQLFNAYLAVKEYEKAAESLYQCYLVNEVSIQPENELWLAHFYANSANEGNSEGHNRASLIFQKILKVDDTFALHFNPEQAYLEAEVLKYSELLSSRDRKLLLSSLIDLQERHPQQSWKLQRQALFELGKTYLSLDDSESALKVFDQLITSAAMTPSYYSNAALLEKSRILLSRCKERSETNPTIANILSNLKDLQIQKKLACEPLHLEAALEYADIRASLAPQESRRQSAIFFLNRIKDDFNMQEDPISKDYHEARLRLPEKDMIFQNYMKCIEAEILRLEAEIAREEDNLARAEQAAQVSKSLLEEVLNDDQITPYLRNRAELNLKSLGSR